MLDLLITTIGMIFIFIGPFFLITHYKIFNWLLLVINFILIFVLLLFEFNYKTLDSWKNPEVYHPIQKTEFLPIKSIKGVFDSNSNLIGLDFRKTNGIFSIVKDDEYSKECLHNYYIKQASECPMTDIILEKTQVNTHDNYVEQKISENMYLYFTKESKLDGKLYEDISINSVSSINCDANNEFMINNACSNIIFKSNFNYNNISSIINLEEEKKSNPFKNFKNYVNYCDKICLTLVILSFIFTFFEPYGNKVYNYFKVINWAFRILILILLSIRYHKYRNIKKYLNEHKDIYKDYLPNKVFNYDTAILSISISFFVYYILYLIFPSKCHCKNITCINDIEENERYIERVDNSMKRIFVLSLSLFIIFVNIIIYEIINDKIIYENYDIINYNWKQNPIESISIERYSNNEYISFSYENININYKTMEYNYYDISTNNNDNLKICGKDSQDNDLYFPKDIECPVNDIFICKYDLNEYDDYTKIKLSDEAGYLYYTNKKTSGKIITAIVGYETEPKIYSGSDNSISDSYDEEEYFDINERNIKRKSEKIENFNTVFFYEEIDKWYKSTYKLYAINYLGVNNNLKSKINDFQKNLDNKYLILLFLKYFSYFFNLVCFIYYNYVLLNDVQLCPLGFGIILLLVMLFYIIINTISLNVNIKYIQYFLNKINIDFERNKCDSIWAFLLIIIGIIFFFYYISIIVYKFLSNGDYNCLKSSTYESNPLENNTLIKNYDPVNSRENIRKTKSIKVDEKSKKKEEEEKRREEEEKRREEEEKRREEERIKAEEKRKKVEEDIIRVEVARKKAEEDRIRFEEARKKAEEDRKKAEEERKKAEEERIKAEELIKEMERMKDEETNKCLYCTINDLKIILVPCGHLCFCQSCFNQYKSRGNKKCPICRIEFTNGMEVFPV